MTREEIDKALRRIHDACRWCNGSGTGRSYRGPCVECDGRGTESGDGSACRELFEHVLARIDALEAEIATLKGKP